MLKYNGSILKLPSKAILDYVAPTPPSTTYYVTTSATHGTVTANPTEGTTGTEVTLSNTPDTHYHFGSYTLTGATLKNANQFDIANSDVSVVGNFIEDTKYSVTCTNDGHGTIAASPTSNYSGSMVTLSNTPDAGYTFDKYTLISGTGASISGNTLTIGTSNVTVRGDFVVDYNPLGLPANTVRVRTSDGNPPNKNSLTTYETATLVSGTTDVYDVYKSGTNFYRLLYYSNNIVEVLGANTTGITNMNGMFQGCSSLTTVPLFDTSSVTMMDDMFTGCSSLTTVPLFNTTSVTIMSYMFSGCSSLTTVPLFDTSSITTMAGMLQNCSSLTSIPLFNTSSVTTMEYMFNGCSSLTSVPLFNTSSVTTMNDMFKNCSSLTSVPLFNTSNVTQMAYMFQNCSSLTTVPLFNTSNVTTMYAMFKDCTKVQSGALALYQQASTQTTPPSYHTQTFRNCGKDTTTGAAELAQIPSNWK